MAKIFDAEILPLWSERFGRMLLRRLQVPTRAMVLDVGTGTGYPALELLRRMDGEGRIISIDPSSAMLDVAREKAGALGGKRVFFRSESAEPKLSFTDEVFDLVVSNAALGDFELPARAIADFARVTKPGGRVLVTLPLAGTFAELTDLLREVLIQRDRVDALERLDAYEAVMPSPKTARGWLHHAGLVDTRIEHEPYTLVFRSSREFFFSPVIEYGPLLDWKEIVGRGDGMQEVFGALKQAIDRYFAGRPFALTVHAGLLAGRKPLEEERALARDESTDAGFDEQASGVLHLGTGEIEVLESTDAMNAPDAEPEDPDDDPDYDPDLDDVLTPISSLPRGVRR